MNELTAASAAAAAIAVVVANRSNGMYRNVCAASRSNGMLSHSLHLSWFRCVSLLLSVAHAHTHTRTYTHTSMPAVPDVNVCRLRANLFQICMKCTQTLTPRSRVVAQ